FLPRRLQLLQGEEARYAGLPARAPRRPLRGPLLRRRGTEGALSPGQQEQRGADGSGDAPARVPDPAIGRAAAVRQAARADDREPVRVGEDRRDPALRADGADGEEPGVDAGAAEPVGAELRALQV